MRKHSVAVLGYKRQKGITQDGEHDKGQDVLSETIQMRTAEHLLFTQYNESQRAALLFTANSNLDAYNTPESHKPWVGCEKENSTNRALFILILSGADSSTNSSWFSGHISTSAQLRTRANLQMQCAYLTLFMSTILTYSKQLGRPAQACTLFFKLQP